MHPFIWFCAILALAVVYGIRIRAVVGRVKNPLLHWLVAVVMVGAAVIGGVLATRYEVSIPHDATIAFQGCVLLACAWLGLRYWSSWRPWDGPAAVLALVLVCLFFGQPSRYNNVTLAVMSLGMSVGGYYMSKRFLRVFFGLYALFDIYMVWFSDLADQLSKTKLGPFPTTLLVGRFDLPFMEISTFDVAMGALAVVGILRHRGVRRGVDFAAALAASMLGLVILTDMIVNHVPRFQAPPAYLSYLLKVPAMALMAPLVWALLSGHKRPDPVSPSPSPCS